MEIETTQQQQKALFRCCSIFWLINKQTHSLLWGNMYNKCNTTKQNVKTKRNFGRIFHVGLLDWV